MANKKFSIYVHIPFCIRKCHYCDFNSYANINEEIIEQYVQKLVEDIEKDNSFSKEDVCKTIYIGGGTPSYIDEKYIIKIIKSIKEKYNIDTNPEITIEVNPCSVTKEKLETYKECGINRLSIGLQTTNNDRLKLIGRSHTFEEFKEKYNIARNVGFNNINVDLMLGLPNETLEDVEKDLEEIIRLQPEHISCYSLIVYENTPMYEISKKENMPNEELERDMYHLVQKRLKENGYEQYEISNFSKENMYSKHNMMCWTQSEYIGFGAGASSFIGNTRLENVEKIHKYIANENYTIQEIMDNEQLMNEYMILGFRLLNGISIKEFTSKFGINPLVKYEDVLQKLESEQLIDIDNEHIFPTLKGIDLNNSICIEFI